MRERGGEGKGVGRCCTIVCLNHKERPHQKERHAPDGRKAVRETVRKLPPRHKVCVVPWYNCVVEHTGTGQHDF